MEKEDENIYKKIPILSWAIVDVKFCQKLTSKSLIFVKIGKMIFLANAELILIHGGTFKLKKLEILTLEQTNSERKVKTYFFGVFNIKFKYKTF